MSAQRKMGRSSRRTVVVAGVLAVLYFLSARLGLRLEAISGVATPVWPPTGLSLAALLIFGPQVWPGVALGAFAANASVGEPLPIALAITIGNTLEALLGSYLLRRVAFHTALDRLRDVLALAGLGAVVSTLASATVGALAVQLGGLGGGFGQVWRVWWVGDMMGDLLVAPALLAWSTKIAARRSIWLGLEAIALLLMLVVAGGAVFHGWIHYTAFHYAYSLLPALVWAALRFGQRGTSVAVLITAALGVWGTIMGRGPFGTATPLENLVSLQTALGVIATTTLVLGAAIEERRRAVRVREEFIALASHELRNPIMPLKMSLQSLVRDYRRGSLPANKLIGKLEVAVRQAQRIEQLTEDLLDVSRLDRGSLELHPETSDLSEIARDVVARFEEQAARVGSTMTLRADTPVQLNVDRLRIEQVVTNLLSNAIKFGEGRPIEVSVDSDNGVAHLIVRDQGIGIPKEKQLKIFDRFARAADDQHYGGLGLGLFIAHQLVHAHGGRISVESQPGAGTSLTVELPIQPGSQQAR